VAQVLRQSTAVDVRLGPFVDVGDGFTPETGVTIAASDDKAVLKAGGAATVTMAGAFAAVTGADGWYDYTAAAGDLDTVGDVTFVMRDDSVYLPVFARFQVLEEDIYDALYAVSAAAFDTNQRIDVGMWLGTAVTLSSSAPDVNVQSQDNIDFGATQKASINTEADTALTDLQLDKLLTAAVIGANVTDNSVFAKLVSASATADWDNFVNTSDSLQAIRDVAPHGTAMRGTDSALLASSAPTNFGDLSITVTTGLVDITQAAADKVWSSATRTLTAFSTALALSVWDVLESAIVTASTIGLKLKNNLDVVLSTRATPAQVNTEVDNALNTAIPGGPTADSINERVLAIDDLSQAAGAGDLAAILTDTGTDGVLIATGAIVPTTFAAGAVDAAAIAAAAIGASELASDAVTEIRDAILPVTNTALSNIEFLFVSSGDHVTPVTGATGISGSRSIDGGAFAAVSGAIAEVANGIYQFDALAADMNGGIITFRFLATGGTPAAPDDTFLTIVTGIGV